MNQEFQRPQHSWPRKFAVALRGIVIGVRGHSSFVVHLPVAVGVIVAASWLGVALLDWCVLMLCIALVFTAELFNSALELLARAIDRRYNQLLADALDIASGAVLVASIGAGLVGLLLLLTRLLERWPTVI